MATEFLKYCVSRPLSIEESNFKSATSLTLFSKIASWRTTDDLEYGLTRKSALAAAPLVFLTATHVAEMVVRIGVFTFLGTINLIFRNNQLTNFNHTTVLDVGTGSNSFGIGIEIVGQTLLTPIAMITSLIKNCLLYQEI